MNFGKSSILGLRTRITFHLSGGYDFSLAPGIIIKYYNLEEAGGSIIDRISLESKIAIKEGFGLLIRIDNSGRTNDYTPAIALNLGIHVNGRKGLIAIALSALAVPILGYIISSSI